MRKTSGRLQDQSSALAWSALAWQGQSGTFVLKSTGGFAQAEWSPSMMDLDMDTQSKERCLPRRITTRANMTPSASACSGSARIREKHAISRSDTLQIHSARNTNSERRTTTQRPGRPRTGAPSTAAGFPNRRSILTIRLRRRPQRPLYDAGGEIPGRKCGI